MTIEQALQDADLAAKAGRVWGTIPVGGGRIVMTENGMLIELAEADRGDGTVGPEVWPFGAGFRTS